MPRKPAYEKRDRRVTQLAEEARELRVREAALTQSKEMFQKTFESQLDAIFILDAQIPPTITDCNPAAERVFGYARQELLGRTTELLHTSEARLRDFQKQLYSAIATQGFFHLDDFMMKRKAGTLFPSEHTVVSLNDEEGTRIGWVSVVRDISERKRAETAIRMSEERYRSLVEDMPALVCRFHPDGVLKFVNSRYCSCFGKRREELIGSDFFQFIPEQDQQKVKKHFLSLSKEKPMVTYEHRVISPDGSIQWQQSTDRALFDENGAVKEFQSMGIDITERKQAEQSLHEAKLLIEKTFASLSEAVFVVEPVTRTIIACNSAVERMFGYSEKEVIGQKTEFMHVDTEAYEKYVAELLQALEREGVYKGEFRMRRKDGNIILAEHTVTEICDDSGHRTATVSVIRDITDSKRVEEALREREKQLEIKSRSLEEVNTALRVLLKKRDEDREEFQERVLMNVKELVEPYIEKLARSRMDDLQKAHLEILGSNLRDIVSPFAYRLSSIHFGLTPTEIRVANLVKEGRTTKEIAALTNSSVRAIEFHRQNLRKKLGLKSNNSNLRSHLFSLA
jgi:PAS domain S-box-containing protein